ncbi:MAG: hypothetical protein ACREOI_10970 [bacterium]
MNQQLHALKTCAIHEQKVNIPDRVFQAAFPLKNSQCSPPLHSRGHDRKPIGTEKFSVLLVKTLKIAN